MKATTRKLLILGLKGFERAMDEVRVDCVGWESLRDLANIKDYDTVVLDLIPIESMERRNKVDWAHFRRLLDFGAVVDILLHSGRIVVLGDPRFSIRLSVPESYRQGSGEAPFLDWTGIRFRWEDQPGDTVRFKNYGHEGLAELMKHLRQWAYSLEKCELNPSIEEDLRNAGYHGYSVRLENDVFCRNRYGNGLAFAMRFLLSNQRAGSSSSGWMLFLPRISLNEEETVQLVLRDVCGVETDLPEPPWLSSIIVPGQGAIDSRILEIESALQAKSLELDAAKRELAQARNCLKLLYE